MNGDGPEPYASEIDRICEAFRCTPTVAMRELDETPEEFLEEIMELRAYRQLVPWLEKPQIERPQTPFMRLAEEIEEQLTREELEAKGIAVG